MNHVAQSTRVVPENEVAAQIVVHVADTANRPARVAERREHSRIEHSQQATRHPVGLQ
jgi:hypothetical protein